MTRDAKAVTNSGVWRGTVALDHPRGEIHHFNVMRGLAVWIVMAAHIAHWIYPAWILMPMFFCLSAYLVSRPLLIATDSGKQKGPLLRQFYLRRAARIVPPYLLLLAIVIPAIDALLRYCQQPTLAPYDGLAALTYTYNFHIASPDFQQNDPLIHLWSLSVEEQFYLLCPLFLLTVRRLRLVPSLALLVVTQPLLLLAAMLWMRSNPTLVNEDVGRALYVLPITYLASFALGIALNFTTMAELERWKKPLAIICLSPIAVGVVIYLGTGDLKRAFFGPYHLPDRTWSWVYTYFSVWAFALVALGLLLPYQGGRLADFFSGLGKYSYVMYLAHLPVIRAVEYLLGSDHSARWFLPVFVVSVIVCTLLARCSYRFIEQPILQRVRRVG